MSETTEIVKRRGGRPRGSLNRRTVDAQALSVEMNFDPLAYLLSVAKNRRLPHETRLKAAVEAVKYLYPRLSTKEVSKSVEVSVDIQTQLHTIMLNPELAAAADKLCLGLMNCGAEFGGSVIDVPAHEAARLPEPEE